MGLCAAIGGGGGGGGGGERLWDLIFDGGGVVDEWTVLDLEQ